MVATEKELDMKLNQTSKNGETSISMLHTTQRKSAVEASVCKKLRADIERALPDDRLRVRAHKRD